MSLVFLSLAMAALWINLAGAGIAAWTLLKDYALARFAGVLAFCLAAFFLEHFAGWGPRPPLMPLTTAGSLWLLWRHRGVLRENWATEAFFATGFLYCLLWRYAFPDIDMTGEKMPNLAMIEAYMRGTRLPTTDVWLPPLSFNFYYSFQHYCASLMGRILGLVPGVTYHLAYCTLAGFIVMLCGSTVSRLCAWRPGRVLSMLALVVGGSGSVVAAHALMNHVYLYDSVRFLGGALYHGRANALGNRVAAWMAKPGVDPRDLPMEPLSYILANGDFHPPLAGYALLAFAAALIAAQAAGTSGRVRTLNNALLAATVPIALISNAWILPLQALLVGGWFLYRALCRDSGFLLPALAGVAAAALLEYPYVIEFAQQPISRNAAISITASADHTPLLGWLMTFWPVAGILVLALFNRERRSLVVFLVVIWTAELAVAELLYNQDIYGGVWIRFNTTLKWWAWIYAGIVVMLGAVNLGSSSRVCRYGTLVLLVPTLIFAKDLGSYFRKTEKGSVGNLDGNGWIKDAVIRDLILDLRSRPDGVALESGLQMANTVSPSVSLFAGKMSYLGWPWHETTWRGAFAEIQQRLTEGKAFYEVRIDDPLKWLLQGNIRYVLWLPGDNLGDSARFGQIDDKIKMRYLWHHLYGNDRRFQVGFWERTDEAQSPAKGFFHPSPQR
jgi:uncharacterized membrane protein